MGKIDFKRIKSGGRHTVVVKLPFEDAAGNVTTEEMRVVYRGVSLHEGAEIEAEAIAEEARTDQRTALVNVLAGAVVALPDVIDGDKPVEPTPDFFSTLDTFYLNRINAAIQQDRQGPNA